MSIRNLFLLTAMLSGLNARSQDLGPMSISLFPSTPYDHLYSTMLFTAGNGFFIVRNLTKMQGPDHRRSNAGFGLVTGLTQTMYGVLYQGRENGYTKEIAAVDITVGLATMVTSAIRLFKKHPEKEALSGLNLISLPNHKTGSLTCGFALSRRF